MLALQVQHLNIEKSNGRKQGKNKKFKKKQNIEDLKKRTKKCVLQRKGTLGS